MIRIENLRKEYPDTTPLTDVSVTINDGDVISIMRNIHGTTVKNMGTIWSLPYIKSSPDLQE